MDEAKIAKLEEKLSSHGDSITDLRDRVRELEQKVSELIAAKEKFWERMASLEEDVQELSVEIKTIINRMEEVDKKIDKVLQNFKSEMKLVKTAPFIIIVTLQFILLVFEILMYLKTGGGK